MPYNFLTGKWEPDKCPICGSTAYRHDIFSEFGIGVVEEHGYCNRCGYWVEKAYSPTYEGFSETKRGWRDYDGVYHEKNYKKRRRVRRKHLKEVKAVRKANPHSFYF